MGRVDGPKPCNASTSFSLSSAKAVSVLMPACSNARRAGAASFAIQPSVGALATSQYGQVGQSLLWMKRCPFGQVR
jgi:hypothetical protein